MNPLHPAALVGTLTVELAALRAVAVRNAKKPVAVFPNLFIGCRRLLNERSRFYYKLLQIVNAFLELFCLGLGSRLMEEKP